LQINEPERAMFVLVVDDNLLFATRLLGQIRRAGWGAAAVGIGPQSLPLARQRRPDAIVVNLAPTGAGFHTVHPGGESRARPG
jgi:hypothetical protein